MADCSDERSVNGKRLLPKHKKRLPLASSVGLPRLALLPLESRLPCCPVLRCSHVLAEPSNSGYSFLRGSTIGPYLQQRGEHSKTDAEVSCSEESREEMIRVFEGPQLDHCPRSNPH
ncbi:hypothetical protein BHE74_00003301 [Ensete ventricosum]|nr:hypothetical protein BHE74_00003301 [Ensete ventricosum]RZR75608.1 hypothetical protein BHM03_00000021 [Ensete ventricosum]